jgi:DNA polymerase-3 subunit epsilon
MITNEDYISWGVKLFEKTKEICKLEFKQYNRRVEIYKEIKKKYEEEQEDDFFLNSIDFRSFLLSKYFNGPQELRVYWINNIVKFSHNPNDSLEINTKNLLNNIFRRQILNDFDINHFNDQGKFILNYPENDLNIAVPSFLDYYQVLFAIRIIEEFTVHKVSKISLTYYTYDPDINIGNSVWVAFDDCIDKHKGRPVISKNKFLNFKFLSYKNWFKEIPEFNDYINQRDNDTYECKSCGDSIYAPDGSNSWCSFCQHSIDKEGKCISDNCESCNNNISEEIHDNENKNDFPVCKTCGDSNVVSDHLVPYWWCSDCEHWIDQKGNRSSDDNNDNDAANELHKNNGPYYLFFDTETTGVPKDWKAPITNFDNWPRIVQLAWLIYDSQGNQISKNEYVIKPIEFEIPLAASNIHGITTQKALEVGVSIDDVLLKFEKHCLQSSYLIAHNINFDSKVTGSEFLRILSRNPISNLEHLCTMESSTNYCKIPGNYGYKWPKLSELHIKLFGIDFEGAHDALADIEATARCFWEMKKLELINLT